MSGLVRLLSGRKQSSEVWTYFDYNVDTSKSVSSTMKNRVNVAITCCLEKTKPI